MSGYLLLLGLAVVVIVGLLLLTRNAALLFAVQVRNGRIKTVRGRAPKGLIRDLNDVLKQRPVPEGSLRVFIRDGSPALSVQGDFKDHEKQRLRNVLGTWPVAKIRAAPRRSK